MGALNSWRRSQQDLNPGRDAERERVSANAAATLRARGVRLTGAEDSDELAYILSAVEEFESAVSALGGDRMVNAPDSSQPENEAFVLPRRGEGESPRAYADRLSQHAAQLINRAD